MSNFTDIETQETYESSTILFFKKFDNEWKLFSIEFAGQVLDIKNDIYRLSPMLIVNL
jgi:hypothetical protein